MENKIKKIKDEKLYRTKGVMWYIENWGTNIDADVIFGKEPITEDADFEIIEPKQIEDKKNK